MFDIITFGSARRDIFLILKNESYQILEGDFPNNKAICFSLGSKFFIDRVKLSTGGGGTNTACTFKRQGFRTAYCGKVGDDRRGRAIIKELEDFKVDTSLLQKDKRRPTAYSIIFSSQEEERTILVRQGACDFLSKEEIPWVKLKKTKWFYLAPLGGKSADVFGDLVMFARRNNIKVAANLGSSQLKLTGEYLGAILKEIDILLLNSEEASLLTGTSEKNELAMMKKLVSFGTSLVVVTKGRNGSAVSDGQHIFEAGAPAVAVVEKTGAGDAYASGFVSGLLLKNDIEYAIQLATANAAGCIGKIGAKRGLLKGASEDSWSRVKVTKTLLK